MSVTTVTYQNFQDAYDHFNKALFANTLPENVLLTLVPHKGAYGYYRHNAFECATQKPIKKGKRNPAQGVIHEIALNPFAFTGRTREQTLSTIVHEMVHLWEMMDLDELPKRPTHTKKWADKMESLGLMPSSTGAEGGKRTGRKVSHWIIPGGAFVKAAKTCKVEFDFIGKLKEPEKKGSRRTKYTCPSCETNAYGKEGINLTCGDCDEQMV